MAEPREMCVRGRIWKLLGVPSKPKRDRNGVRTSQIHHTNVGTRHDKADTDPNGEIGGIKQVHHPIFGSTTIVLRRAQMSPLKGMGIGVRQAFRAIKGYVASSLSLSQPVSGENLYLYLATSATVMSSTLVRLGEGGKQRPVYFMSKVLTDAETRYIDFE